MLSNPMSDNASVVRHPILVSIALSDAKLIVTMHGFLTKLSELNLAAFHPMQNKPL